MIQLKKNTNGHTNKNPTRPQKLADIPIELNFMVYAVHKLKYELLAEEIKPFHSQEVAL